MIKLIKYFTTLLNRNKSLRVRCFAFHKKGFTLAEMMIVIAIIGIFSSLTVVNFRGNEKVRDIDNQARLVLDGIKQMQTASLSGKIIDGQVPVAYIFEINQCLSGDCSYSLKARNASNDIIPIDNVSLDKSIVEINGNNLKIEITPPRSDIVVYFNDVPNDPNSAYIRLTHNQDSSIFRGINISGISGRIIITKD